MARQLEDNLEANFADGKTFPNPGVRIGDVDIPHSGFFMKPETPLMHELDLAKLWREVKARVAPRPAQRVRDRRPIVMQT